jgi:hypothetical protein
MNYMGLNLGHHSGKLATNHLSYGTAFRDNVTFLLTALPPKCEAVKGLTKKGDIQKTHEWKQYKGQHSSPLNQSMQVARSSEIWVTLFQTKHRHITDDGNLQKGTCFLN